VLNKERRIIMKRKYFNSDESWYAKLPHYTPYDDIIFGMYDEDGSCEAEMTMNWTDGIGAKLNVWDEAFGVLIQFNDVIVAVAEHRKTNDKLTKQDFIKILESCGFEDSTE
jgi:hypothetical protein